MARPLTTTIIRYRRRKQLKILRSLGLFAVNGAVLGVVVAPALAVATMCVLLAHEFGHVFVAWRRGGDVEPPLFITLGIVTFGITRIKNLPEMPTHDKVSIINAGPLCGMLTAALLTVTALLLWGPGLARVYALTMPAELYSATLGSDGKARRRTVNPT